MQSINTALKKISDFFGAIALFFMAFLMLGTSIDVTVRAIYGRSISGVFELAELSMVLVVFLGLGWTKIDDGHIRVTLLLDRMSERTQRIMETISWALAALLLLLLAMPATNEAIHSFEIREFRWGYIEFPIWWAKIVLALGLWFGFIQMAVYTVQVAIFGREKKALDFGIDIDETEDLIRH